MAITPQLSWDERLQYSLAIERESDAFYRTRDDDPESTYWIRDDVERLHVEIGQRLLRIVPEEEIEQIGGIAGPPAVGLVRGDFDKGPFPAPRPLPRGAVRIVAARIQHTDGGPFVPARGPVTVAEYVQLEAAGANAGCFASIGAKIEFGGNALRLLYIVEPLLQDFQSNAALLPPVGYFETACDWVHHQLTAADWLPVGRI